MKLKKVLSICKANGLYYLYDRITCIIGTRRTTKE